jgi:hypothetical protein
VTVLALLGKLRETAERRLGRAVRVVVIQEAGLDGFWLHRFLEASRAMSSIPPRSPSTGASGGARPTRSMWKDCCAR